MKNNGTIKSLRSQMKATDGPQLPSIHGQECRGAVKSLQATAHTTLNEPERIVALLQLERLGETV